MGNSLVKLVQGCLSGGNDEKQRPYSYPPQQTGQPPAATWSQHVQQGLSQQAPQVAALVRDLHHFEATRQVPQNLSQHVRVAKKTQAVWYEKVGALWKTTYPPPSTPEQASWVVRSALAHSRTADVEGFLSFYGLSAAPQGHTPPQAPLYPPVAPPPHTPAPPLHGKLPPGVQYELWTMPVEENLVPDGDTVTVHVDASRDSSVPPQVRSLADQRRAARQRRDFKTADRIRNQLSEEGYAVLDAKNGGADTLVKKYRVRLRGIDAPESTQTFGQESKRAFRELIAGKPLHLHVYTVDQYGRLVADVNCGNVFVQEYLLKRGSVWHYSQFDHRPQFAQWMKEARAGRVGLWADGSAQEPWLYRKDRR